MLHFVHVEYVPVHFLEKCVFLMKALFVIHKIIVIMFHST
jgi:hypothetical protein